MFSQFEDEGPTRSDVGKFIPQTELESWWSEMQRKYPEVFTADDKCPEQVKQGTKLRAYFDGDKNKEMNAEVVGSKFKNEFPSGKYAMYVVRTPPNSPELSYIHLTEVGEEDGWEIIS